jgi:hypothetical protein
MALLGEPKVAVVMAVAFVPLLLTLLYQSAVALPRWGRTRLAQMQELATFVLEMTSRSISEPPPGSEPTQPPRSLPDA